MAIITKVIYRVNAMPMKMLAKIFKDLKKTVLNFIWKSKKPRIAKTICTVRELLEASQYLTSNSTTELQY